MSPRLLLLIPLLLVVAAPARAGQDALIYHGGAVMPSSATYAIFWLPGGHDYAAPPASSNGYEQLVERYFQDVGDTSFYAILPQYSPAPNQPVLNSSHLAGVWLDPRPYPHDGSPSDPLSDGDVQAEVKRAVDANIWPTGLSSAFFVFLASGVQVCRLQGACTFTADSPLCAWHSSFQRGGQAVLYAAMPDAASIPGCTRNAQGRTPNGDPTADLEVSFVSHEQFEMVTNPLGDGWTDGTGLEIGDKCQGEFGPPTDDGRTVTLHGDPYALQAEWSNADGACVLASRETATSTPAPTDTAVPAATPTVLPTATPTPTPPATATLGPFTSQPERCRAGYRLVRGRCRRRPHHRSTHVRGRQ